MDIKIDLLNKALNIFNSSALYKGLDANAQLEIIKELYIGLVKIYNIKSV